MNRVACMIAAAIPLTRAGCMGPGACTLNIEAGITLEAREAGTGRNVTDSAQGTVSEGTFVDSLRPFGVEPDGRVVSLHAADEREGTYGVFVERPGYQSVSLSNVRVTGDECHVHTVDLDVTMVPIPQN